MIGEHVVGRHAHDMRLLLGERVFISCVLFVDIWLVHSVFPVLHKASLSLYKKLMTSHFLSSYEPELFPGLIYRMIKPRIVLLIFVSGKVVLTGKLKGK